MKALQSFWSKPFLKNISQSQAKSLICGFSSKKMFFFSWALSALNLRENFDEVVLVTDDFGKRILIDGIGLPYTQVIVTLDDINRYDADLWALGKIYAYQIQQQPFFHLDGDAYLYSRLPSYLNRAPLLCQNMEKLYPYHLDFFNYVFDKLVYFPPEIEHFRYSVADPGMINAGIIGGNDLDFFQRYTQNVFEFIDRNLVTFDQFKLADFNVIFEQYLFTCMARLEQRKVRTFIPFQVSRNFDEVVQFHRLPNRANFIHLLGPLKQKILYAEQTMLRLKLKYPQYYDRIENLINYNII